MIRKKLGLLFVANIIIACVFKAILALLGFVLVLAAWLI